MTDQPTLPNSLIPLDQEKNSAVNDPAKPIRGYPVLQWTGKRLFTNTQHYPAQLREVYGQTIDSWRNKIYWGDNFQVMSHLMREFRGRINLIYIDPPFDSKADYKLKIRLKNKQITNDSTVFEEKQYSDIWVNDEYLQFMYERLVLLRELLSKDGTIYLHCDWHKAHHLRCLMDEVFGPSNFLNQITWQRTDPHNNVTRKFGTVSDILLVYVKSNNYTFNLDAVRVPLSKAALSEYSLIQLENGQIVSYTEGLNGRRVKLNDATVPSVNKDRQFIWRGARPSSGRSWPEDIEGMEEGLKTRKYFLRNPDIGAARCKVSYLDENLGQVIQDIWTDCGSMKGGSDYPTQKPIELLERIIKASSNPNDLILDCFMGSGTTQAAAVKFGRRFIGADINLGAIETTIKRLLNLSDDIETHQPELTSNDEYSTIYTGFEVYNVNHYDVFRNPIEAKDLLLEALELERFEPGYLYDGQKDGRLYKIMPVNRIATRADLSELITGFDYKAFERRQAEHPDKPVEKITLVCMGHEPDLAAHLKNEVHPYKIDVEVVDILRDKQDIQFKRDAEAKISIKNGQIEIEAFYPMNLLQKLSLQQENVEDWRELVESVMVDWNYDGAVLQPAIVDIPEGDKLVKGKYAVPADAGTIRVKITDLLSESLEVEVANA